MLKRSLAPVVFLPLFGWSLLFGPLTEALAQEEKADATSRADSVLPLPPEPFQGKIGLTYKDSEAVKDKLKIPATFGLKDPPNIPGTDWNRSRSAAIPSPPPPIDPAYKGKDKFEFTGKIQKVNFELTSAK